uniref:Uncharacterized protein n=1 Tax=Neogobius melanostomus TaxID=47308 RepID=A0A8C6SME3_9GOBI
MWTEVNGPGPRSLTGSARKIKDNAADFHNEHQVSVGGGGVCVVPSPPGGGAEELQSECSRLQDVLSRMVTGASVRVSLWTFRTRPVQDPRPGPALFHTWTTEDFGEPRPFTHTRPRPLTFINPDVINLCQ